MEKIQYFNLLLDIISEEMDVTKEEILGKCRKVDVVDARWLLVYMMYEHGYKAKDLVPLMGIARRSIDHAICQFEERLNSPNSSVDYAYKVIKHRTGNN